MKTKTLLALSITAFLSFTGISAQGVGIGTPSPQAALDITSTSSGFLPPRIALSNTTSSNPVVNPNGGGTPITGTIVYNTDTANDVSPGYYYWNGASWTRLASQAASQNTFQIITSVRTSPTGSNNPTLTTIFGNFDVLSFDVGNLQEAFFSIEMPPNYAAGTTIYPRLNIMPLGGAANEKIRFYLDYTWANPTDAFDTSWSPPLTADALAGNKQYGNIPAAFQPISGTGKLPGSILLCRVYRFRNADSTNDAYPNPIGGLSVTVDITTN